MSIFSKWLAYVVYGSHVKTVTPSSDTPADSSSKLEAIKVWIIAVWTVIAIVTSVMQVCCTTGIRLPME